MISLDDMTTDLFNQFTATLDVYTEGADSFTAGSWSSVRSDMAGNLQGKSGGIELEYDKDVRDAKWVWYCETFDESMVSAWEQWWKNGEARLIVTHTATSRVQGFEIVDVHPMGGELGLDGVNYTKVLLRKRDMGWIPNG